MFSEALAIMDRNTELYMITDSIKSGFDTDLVIVYNINGFYQKIKEMNDFMMEAGALNEQQYKFFTWCNTADEVIEQLDKWRTKVHGDSK